MGHYEGDTLGDNRDYWANLGLGRAVVAPSCPPPALSVPGVSLVVSGCTGPQQWVPVLAIGHAVHQGPGPVVLRVRTTCVNGPAVPEEPIRYVIGMTPPQVVSRVEPPVVTTASTTRTRSPGATKSGFLRPSAVGPREEK